MNQNHSGMYKNNLSSHAALLLSASPTIVSSPLNNPQQSSSDNSSNQSLNLNRSNHPTPNNEIAKRLAMSRRTSTTPLVSNPNLDQVNQGPVVGPSVINNTLPNNESYINFKKPQNEIFKKLDGKIQKIVAAHSNLNKLYALNDFSGISKRPNRPFELPPQLPPPPPCVPRTISPTEPGKSSEFDYPNLGQPNKSLLDQVKSIMSGPLKAPLRPPGQTMTPTSSQSPSSLNLDNTISRLHQQRQGNAQTLITNTQRAHQRRPNVGQPGPMKQVHPVYNPRDNIVPFMGPSTVKPHGNSTGTPKPNKVDPAIMRLMAQKIRDALDNDRGPKNHQHSSASTIAEKKKFQVDLINLLKREISVVAKSANINFTTPPRASQPPKSPDKSLLKQSPQTLFNTIHRETSLLLKQRDNIRSTLSIIPSPQKKISQFRSQDRNSFSLQQQRQQQHQQQLQQLQQQLMPQQQPQKIPTTIKLVLPPTEFIPEDTNKTDNAASPRKLSSKLKPPPSYQFIRNKLRQFQLKNHISLSKTPSFSANSNLLLAHSRKPGHQKTLDNIVDRLQAKSSPQPSISGDLDDSVGQFHEDSKSLSFQQRIVNTSAQMIRNSRMNNTLTLSHTPIPVFRTPYGNVAKNVYYNRSNAVKALSGKSKKNKKIHNLGLILSCYLERELEGPKQEKITIDDYARALNLVRPNDVSLQRHKDRLLQSETRWKPLTNRPVRLRRLRGEKIHMPASASYRAASKAGLQ